jgi:hypothetical protein
MLRYMHIACIVITEMECVYCAVRPEMFIIQFNLSFYRVKNTVLWNVRYVREHRYQCLVLKVW